MCLHCSEKIDGDKKLKFQQICRRIVYFRCCLRVDLSSNSPFRGKGSNFVLRFYVLVHFPWRLLMQFHHQMLHLLRSYVASTFPGHFCLLHPDELLCVRASQKSRDLKWDDLLRSSYEYVFHLVFEHIYSQTSLHFICSLLWLHFELVCLVPKNPTKIFFFFVLVVSSPGHWMPAPHCIPSSDGHFLLKSIQIQWMIFRLFYLLFLTHLHLPYVSIFLSFFLLFFVCLFNINISTQYTFKGVRNFAEKKQ